MSSNNFSVQVIAPGVSSFIREGYDYTSIKHKTNFKLRLSNNRGTVADASVLIEGVDNGVFRVPSYGSITIERPSGKANLFVALVEDTKEATSSGIKSGDRTNGLITVVFTPAMPEKINISSRYQGARGNRGFSTDNFDWNAEDSSSSSHGSFHRYHQQQECMNECAVSEKSAPTTQSYKGVGIALGDSSSQTFNQVSKITDIDHSAITTIKIRLVSSAEPSYTSIRNSGNLSNPPLSPPRLG